MKHLIGLALGMMILGGCHSAAERAQGSTAERPKRYLMLVTFFTKELAAMPPEKLSVANDSPYHGVAVPVIDGYDGDPIPSEAEIEARFAVLDKACTKDLWPWVFTNRIYGQAEIEHSHNAPQREYFKRFRAIDLNDQAGALSDFYALWRASLRLAKRHGAPGVVIDLEGYNDYRCYKVSYVAKKLGISADEVMTKLRGIGAALGRIVEEEYPEAVIWTLFTALHKPRETLADGRDAYSTVAYMSLGLLDYLKNHDVPALVLDGGESGGPGYYNETLEKLQKSIAERRERFAPWLQMYPGRLALAGTISTWHDASLLTGWIAKAKDNPNLQTIDDFRPFLKALFDAYPYVWIYAAGAAKHNPYDPEIAAKHNAVYREVLEGE